MIVSLEKPPLHELAHYGVLGMKWGVRKEDTFYKKSKLTKAQQRERLKKILLITGGVTLAAATVAIAAYSIKKRSIIADVTSRVYRNAIDATILKEEVDHFVPKGATIHRVSSVAENSFRGDRLYASINENDSARYKVLFTHHLKTNKLYNVSLKTLADIKAPSSKKQFEIYRDMLEKDTNGFADKFVRAFSHYPDEGFAQLRKDTNAYAERSYRSFITKLGNSEYPPGNIFINHLKSLGYNGVLDANDAGVYARNPIIVLDPKVNLAISSANRISLGEHVTSVMMAKRLPYNKGYTS